MYECRICLEEDTCDNMIAPCKCTGTNKYVHRGCLDTWRSTSDREDSAHQCPNCLAFYEFEEIPQWKKIFRVGYNCLFHTRSAVAAGVALTGFFGIPQLTMIGQAMGMGFTSSLLLSNTAWVAMTVAPIVVMERLLTGDWERTKRQACARLGRSGCISIVLTISPFFGSIAHGVTVGLDLAEIPRRRFPVEDRVLDLAVGISENTER